MKQHIESFPTIESHYTRKDTKRLYLNQNLSIRKKYPLYAEKCQTTDPQIKPVNENVYRNVFCNEYNLSFFAPKKDQCATCVRIQNTTAAEKDEKKLEYEKHRKEKMKLKVLNQQTKKKQPTKRNLFQPLLTFRACYNYQLPTCHFCITPEKFVFISCVIMKLPLLKMNSVTVGRKGKETGDATTLALAY